MLRDGLDPLQERRTRRQEARLAASRAIKFKDCCASYIESHAPAWRNAKHKTQWETTLSTYAFPVMGHLTVSDVSTDHVLRVLEPIWNSKRETARRLRARMERVLSWAATHGYRSDSNPARWQGNLKNLLAADSKTQPVKHHPALPYHQVKNFSRKLRKQSGVAALALEFTILTAARTSEVILARWDEVSLKRKEWVVPGERMKSGRPHRVPLSKPAIALLTRAEDLDEEYIFPAQVGDCAISNMAMLSLLKRMDMRGVTVHGFRSTFRDWAAEQTSYPNHVVEMALAHVISDKVERAYRRGELLEKRRRLMNDWASYVT